MDIVVKGRRTEVSERFRRHVTDKLAKLARLDGKVIRIDVEICHESNPRLASVSDRVELTCRSRGPVIRAEAAATDPYAALDLAVAKLEARLRRAADRRRVHHGSRTPVSVAAATGALAATDARVGEAEAAPATGGATEVYPGAGVEALTPSANGRVAGLHAVAGEDVVAAAGPFVVREKVHDAAPMPLDQALLEMELVGHDFFLFVDDATGLPSVVYRRRGYDYGVIRLRTVP